MKCDICGEVNDAVEIHICKQCANKFSDNVNRIKRDLAIYKRALELACHYMEYEYPKKNDDIYYRKEKELEMIFLNKAKEELEE